MPALSELMTDAPLSASLGALQITSVTADSRSVKPGALFAALPGGKNDGRDFIADAVAKGAAAILTMLPGHSSRSKRHDVPISPSPVPIIEVENPRRALALIAARLAGRQPSIIAAVTGTNGKSSVVDFTRQIWRAQGAAAASIGTLGIIKSDGVGEQSHGGLTTPDPVMLHQTLASLAQSGIEYIALEASSHGLDQFRLDGLALTAAAFTNLTRDHLDYHNTIEAYFAAKAGLFDRVLSENGVAVLNADDSHVEALATICHRRGQRIFSFGQSGQDLKLLERVAHEGGQHLTLGLYGRKITLDLPLIGAFQTANALCALGLVIACGGKPWPSLEALKSLKGVPGRLELAGISRRGGTVYVDYAHTPNALETLLDAVRPHGSGQITVVFGCGGDRDAGKRPMMGKIAGEHADRVIITDDNPRTEHAGLIRQAILRGANRDKTREIADRAEAITVAIDELGRGDILVIAGKGHEQGQIVGDKILPFDDLAVARAALGPLNVPA